jgi:hypothetical protein
MTGLIGTTLVLAASCTMDLAGLPGSTSTSASAASGGGSSSASSATSGNGGAGGSSTSSASSSASSGSVSSSASSSSASSSSSGSSSGTGGGGPLLEVAGDLLVDLDVNDLTAGTGTWINKGTLNGVFTAQGVPTKAMSGGQYAVVFDGNDAYLGPDSIFTLEGNSDRSIEVWVLNPSIGSEESMVSWSDRKGYNEATMLSFNYGNDTDYGAVTHMHDPDLAWGSDVTDAPPQNQWHHLAYTHDGMTARVFADGKLKSEKDVTLATKADFSINLAAEREGNTLGQHGSLSIAVVRIHSGALTVAQVKSNYEAEKSRFP